MITLIAFNPYSPSEIHPAKRSRAWTRGELGSIRSALSIYYGDTQGAYPAALEALTTGRRYLPLIPRVETIEHGQRHGVAIYGADLCLGGSIDGKKLRDSGDWGYVNAPGSACHGIVFVDCTHRIPTGEGYPWWWRRGYEYSNELWFKW
ncbi:MAG: hypothetical protein HY927_14430 [Elusimicrobia bacterium]|nr:hypothetical protein [Elusimicrobiota bacterium]